MSSDPKEPRWTPEEDTDAVAAVLLGQLGPEHERLAAVFDGVDALVDLVRDRPPELHPVRPDQVCYVVTVLLFETEPAVWRRLRLSSRLDLEELHQVLQAAMGWSDSHLHHFVMGDVDERPSARPFLTEFDLEEGEEGLAEADVRLDQVLAEPGELLSYSYDFGDGWLHYVRLDAVEPWADGAEPATCVGGERACPPEDIGGPAGYDLLLRALAGGAGDENPALVAHLLETYGTNYDPDAFDPEAVNRAIYLQPDPCEVAAAAVPEVFSSWWYVSVPQAMVTDIVSRAPDPWRERVSALAANALTDARDLTAEEAELAVRGFQALLRRVGSGITLTSAGYLPPEVVSELWTDLGLVDVGYGKGNREVNAREIRDLRENATRLGLLRVAKRRLTLTAAGRRLRSDPVALFGHLRDQLPFGSAVERDAGTFSLLLAASGHSPFADLDVMDALLAAIGWRGKDASLPKDSYVHARPMMGLLECLAPRKSSRCALVAKALLLRPIPVE